MIRAIDGPLALVRGLRPENLGYGADTQAVQQLWLALREAERACLDGTTIADLATRKLPKAVTDLLPD